MLIWDPRGMQASGGRERRVDAAVRARPPASLAGYRNASSCTETLLLVVTAVSLLCRGLKQERALLPSGNTARKPYDVIVRCLGWKQDTSL